MIYLDTSVIVPFYWPEALSETWDARELGFEAKGKIEGCNSHQEVR